ncbi:MAG: endonuclease/exonuclease/phosphatase family metal-dependent hydrolase [Myxococcota bacterium]|jgi:endonuclease/exonuclease/phosphatase family metal-dependent hydrolase
MRKRLPVAALLVVLFVGLRGGPRLLALLTPGTLPIPESVQSATSPGPGITVATLNVLCSFCTKTGYDDWSARLPELSVALGAHRLDLVALQEVATVGELTVLAGSELTALAHPLWPDSAILYRTARFGLLDSGQVWLSPTPTLPLSRGWRVGMPRLVQWVLLRDRQTGGDLLFASAHLDGDATNKDASAVLIAGIFPPLADKVPVIFAGDLNTTSTDARLDILRGGLSDAEGLAAEAARLGRIEGIPHTRRELHPDRRIDHILLSADWSVQRFLHHAPTYGDPPRRPSDHPLIVAEVVIRQ